MYLTPRSIAGESRMLFDGGGKLHLKQLGSDAVIEIVPGKDHGTLVTAELAARMRREMSEAYLRQTK